MKKVGILTLPLHTNYGGILQAYALQSVLTKMGFNVVVIDAPYMRQIKGIRKILAYSKRAVCKYLLRRRSIIRWEERCNYINSTIRQHTQPFITQHINRLEVSNLSKLKSKDFYAIVVGSDQIWRTLYYPKIENAFLKFAEHWNIKRIAYAASFGVENWEYNDAQTEECRRLLCKFQAVSVRESSGVKLCEKYLHRKAELVLDPTMLLTTEDYISLFKQANTPRSKGNLLCYVLDSSDFTEKVINSIAKDRSLTAFSVNSLVEDQSAPLDKRVQPPVESWLRGFYDAEFVVTDSFHACVFSILFRKQFAVIENGKRGLTRIESLLEMMQIEGRLIKKDSDSTNIGVIDYDAVHMRLNNLKKSSLEFLEMALEDFND